jgi:RNA polymerase sigma-70 factor, ECF subfamily
VTSTEQSGDDRQDNDKVFKDLLVAIIPSLRSFARGLCGSREMADDMAQDAMMRAWAARDSFTPGSNFRAWMFMILRNNYYTTLRKNSRMVSWDPEVAERVLVTDASQHVGIDVADVAAAMQKLSSEQREVLMLVGASGVSYEEAADIMGCAIGTIKSRLARGRAALALLIEGPDEDTTVRKLETRAKRGAGRERSFMVPQS